MKRSDFDYCLPPHCIAHYPLTHRNDSRLLVLNRDDGAMTHSQFKNLINYFRTGDLLVFNNTHVIPARLYGKKKSGGRVEILIERQCAPRCVLAQMKSSKSVRNRSVILFPDTAIVAEVTRRVGDMYELMLSHNLDEVLRVLGHPPIPPYMERHAQEIDWQRYQTIYATQSGSVAAPTAGLHFDQSSFSALKSKGVGCVFITLHIGAGTFQLIRTEDVQQHQMHSEKMYISSAVSEHINATHQRGGRVIAVGTTVMRCLEAVADGNKVHPYRGETNLFITPGYDFQIVDGLVTNFHQPQSTLLVLLCAYAGRKNVLDAYRTAVKEGYRFLSYGDAMLVVGQ